MSATRVATYTGVLSGTTITAANVVAAQGDAIIVYVSNQITVGDLGSMLWGASDFGAPDQEQLSGSSNSAHRMFEIFEATAGTHDVVGTFSDTGVNAGMVVEVWRGLKQSPTDTSAAATGTGTSPSSGNTATLSQAAELVLGLVGTEGPTGDAAGSWSELNAGTRTGTTGGAAGSNVTLSTGYLVTSATTARSAAKTGITSRPWTAICRTFKLADDVTISLGTPSVAATAPAMTISHSATVALGSPVTAATAPAMTTAPITSLSLGSAEVATTAQALTVAEPDRTTYGTDGNGVVDATASMTPEETSVASNRGLRSFGLPYFAAWMQSPGGFIDLSHSDNAPGTGLTKTVQLTVVMALNELPTTISSADEVHQLWSYHEIGGEELFSLGVTPSGRLVGSTYLGPALTSATGIVAADGVARAYTYMLTRDEHFPGYTIRLAMIDDLLVAWDQVFVHQSYEDGFASPTGKHCRVMAFNGVRGTTLCDCTMFEARVVGYTRGEVDWNFNGFPVAPGAGTAWATTNFDLTVGFFDPRPFYPLAAGAFPAESVQGAYKRVLNTQYRRRNIVTPDYRLAGVS